MKRLAFAFCLFPALASAQDQAPPSANDYYKGVVANCTAESASLFEQANRFARQVQMLQRELDELKKKQEEKK